MNKTLLGETTAKMMDWFDEDGEDGEEVVAVGIVVVVQNADGTKSRSRTSCSDSFDYQQIGLFTRAADIVRGIMASDAPDDDDDDEGDDQ